MFKIKFRKWLSKADPWLPGDGGRWKNALQKGHVETGGVMKILYILIVVVVAGVYTSVKTHQTIP